MKKGLLITMVMLLTVIFCSAQIMQPGPQKPQSTQAPAPTRAVNSDRHGTATFTVSVPPVNIMTSYYDYMIGSYNGLPLRVIPTAAGGGYFMTYQGARTASTAATARRAYYSFISNTGTVIVNNEITTVTNREGYPALAVDPVSGKPIYSWHANADTDALYEVQCTQDAFISGFAGLFNEITVPINNPISITSPSGVTTTANEFIWPMSVIGPSPIVGMRRVYVLGRNSVSAPVGAPSENPYIAYADFNADMIESGTPLTWSHTSIPEMNDWNADSINWRRPNYSLCVDSMGNVYCVGYHIAYVGTAGAEIIEPDLDVFSCNNYGQGIWTHYSSSSILPSWNPNDYFLNALSTPYADNQLFWKIQNSSHLNATVDFNGNVHCAATWALTNSDGSYYPAYQVEKEFVFDRITHEFSIREIYPQTYDPAGVYQPWDLVAPWGEVDQIDPTSGAPVISSFWPFCHWDDTMNDTAMQFHYNNIKISEANEMGQMVCVWQDSWRARQANYFGNIDYEQYNNTPEIMMSVSPDNGVTWSDPINLNQIDTPEFANLKPMWVYPADKMIYTGMQNGHATGKIGLMFYDDTTWGAYQLTPPAHPTNDGGRVMFVQLQVTFPNAQPDPTDPFGEPLVLSSSMSIMAGVQINGQPAAEGDVLAAFVNVNGTLQLRGKQTITVNSGVAGCLLQVYTEANEETVSFKLWDASSNQVLNIATTVPSLVNGTIGSWPDNPFWLNALIAGTQPLSLAGGWNMVSTNVHNADMSIANVFDATLTSIQMIKSPEGVYIPGNPFNTLTNISDGKGYFVKVQANCLETLNGYLVDAGTPIPLNSGWNLVGFTPQNQLPILNAVASISPQIIQIKSTEGVYVPGNPYNTLSILRPGRAYWMNLSAPASLVYPISTAKIETPESILSSDVWGCPVVQPNSQTLMLGLDASLYPGDQIGAFVNNELRGLSEVKIVEGRRGALLQVFTDQAGETIEFKALANNGLITSLQPSLQSVPGSTIGNYNAGEFYTLTSGSHSVPALTTRLLSISPNPFKAATTINLNIGKDTEQVSLEIFNIRGQKVRTIYSGTMSYGTQAIMWDGIDDRGFSIASGLYFCRLTAGKNVQTLKIMVLK